MLFSIVDTRAAFSFLVSDRYKGQFITALEKQLYIYRKCVFHQRERGNISQHFTLHCLINDTLYKCLFVVFLLSNVNNAVQLDSVDLDLCRNMVIDRLYARRTKLFRVPAGRRRFVECEWSNDVGTMMLLARLVGASE